MVFNATFDNIQIYRGNGYVSSYVKLRDIDSVSVFKWSDSVVDFVFSILFITSMYMLIPAAHLGLRCWVQKCMYNAFSLHLNSLSFYVR